MGKIELSFDLKGEIAKKFQYVKEKLGIEKDEDVLTRLINERYQRLNRKTPNEKTENP